MAIAAPEATVNWAAVAVESGTPSLQLVKTPCLQTLPTELEPMNLTTPDMVEVPILYQLPTPTLPIPCSSVACNSGDPRHKGRAHHPCAPGGNASDTGRRTLEAQ